MHQRILIAGGPRTGKTTFAKELAKQLGIDALSTDSIGGPWRDSFALVSSWLDASGPWVIEGVSAIGGLRHWLTYNSGAPCERLYWSANAKVELAKNQQNMFKGCNTIWSNIAIDVAIRGIEVHYL